MSKKPWANVDQLRCCIGEGVDATGGVCCGSGTPEQDSHGFLWPSGQLPAECGTSHIAGGGGENAICVMGDGSQITVPWARPLMAGEGR